MNFTIVDGVYADLENIRDDFCNDYLYSNELSNVEIRKKYGLTVGEFNEFARTVKAEHGLSRRPRLINGSPKYYYKHKYGFAIQKHIKDKYVYFGIVPTKRIAETVVEMCIQASWDIPTCLDIVRNYREVVS